MAPVSDRHHDHADAASFQRPFRLADALQRRRNCCPILTGKT
jgi:hypothetical protein